MRLSFDSLNYEILLFKLQYYGLQANALLLLKSYLYERSQYVQIENVKSCSHPVSCGIPQGSVLGPLLMTFLRQLQNSMLLCMLMTQLWCHTLKILVQ